jgi:hypothetical protein
MTVLFNPLRFRMRWALYERFRDLIISNPKIKLYTAEIAFGDRAFAATANDNPQHLQLRSHDILWCKERALNLLERRLPNDWKYAAWIDADIAFIRPDWATETIQQLQLYNVVQMWSDGLDLDYDYKPIANLESFVQSWKNGSKPSANFETIGYYQRIQKKEKVAAPKYQWHPGFAWAWTRNAWEEVGGMLDIGILGAGDNHMAKALIGDGIGSVHPQIKGSYLDEIIAWQTRASRLQKNIGVMNGTIFHHWHGPKINRKYWDRWKILVDNNFDPRSDLEIAENGLYRISERNVGLRDDIRKYFSERNEDALS